MWLTLFILALLQVVILVRQEQQTNKLMSKLSTLGGTLATILSTLEKVVTEVQALKGSLGDVEIPVDAQEKLDNLAALAKTLDDLNPDSTPPTS